MRIRKNANISAFLYTNSNHQTNFCQLNQSPWDIITFPPSSPPPYSHYYQVDGFGSDYNVNLAENWSSIDSIETIESNVHGNNVDNTMKDYELGFMDGGEDMLLCGKLNGKGWECGKVVKNGNIMCEDHLLDLQNEAVWASDKKPAPVSGSSTTGSAGSSRPRRVKKRANTISSNPNEFYYYSGFGPTWGKKRGPVEDKCTTFNACDTGIIASGSNICETSGVDGDMGVEEEEKRVELEHDTTMIKESWSCEVGPTNEDLDYMDEKEEGEKGKAVKKRGRKPIKNRSLKSLM